MSENFSISKPIAPEDIRPGMYVAVHVEIDERVPLFICDTPSYKRIEPVRIARWPCMCSDCAGGETLKVLNVCLPFVMVQRPAGDKAVRTLDVRQHRLVQLSDEYGKAAHKLLAKPKVRKRSKKSR